MRSSRVRRRTPSTSSSEPSSTTGEEDKKKRSNPSSSSSATRESSVYSLSCRWEGCNRPFASAELARNHEKDDHVSAGGLVCKIAGCGKSFTNSQKLCRHFVAHRERQFLCEDCGKKFLYTWDLKRHSFLHSGERPFQCPERGCTRSFTKSINCEAHIQNDHGKDKATARGRAQSASRRIFRKYHKKPRQTSESDEEDEDEDEDDAEEEEEGEIQRRGGGSRKVRSDSTEDEEVDHDGDQASSEASIRSPASPNEAPPVKAKVVVSEENKNKLLLPPSPNPPSQNLSMDSARESSNNMGWQPPTSSAGGGVQYGSAGQPQSYLPMPTQAAYPPHHQYGLGGPQISPFSPYGNMGMQHPPQVPFYTAPQLAGFMQMIPPYGYPGGYMAMQQTPLHHSPHPMAVQPSRGPNMVQQIIPPGYLFHQHQQLHHQQGPRPPNV